MSLTKRLCRSTSVTTALMRVAKDEVALPAAGHGPILGLGRPLADVNRAVASGSAMRSTPTDTSNCGRAVPERVPLSTPFAEPSVWNGRVN
jgi:hypothetical protein